MIGSRRREPDLWGVIVANALESARFLMESRIYEATFDARARYELGVAYSCGTGGVDVDLVEAHKWFNLAALAGSAEGQACRAEIAGEMTMREIAEAQRQARAWLNRIARRAA